MFKRKASALQLDSYGTRLGRETAINKPDIIYAKKWFAYAATLLFIAIDAVCLYSCWNMVQTSNPLMIYLITIGCAVILDFPLALAGYKYKNYKQGLESKESAMLTLILSVIAFTITLIFYFVFRIITKDLVFDTGTTSLLTNAVADSVTTDDSSNKTVLFAAIFNGVIPLCTSISSFAITYVTTDSLNERINKIRKAKITAEANKTELKVAVEEAEDVNAHCDYLIARENDLYKDFIDEINSQALVLKQIARVVVMEKLGTPEAITALKESGDKINQNSGITVVPENETINFVKQYNHN